MPSFVISITASGTASPVTKSVFVKTTSLGLLVKVVFPVTFPVSSIENMHSSSFKIYPSGAIVSLKIYSPTGSLEIVILPSLSVTKGLPFIGVPSFLVTSIVAPGTISPVTKSVFVRTTSLGLFVRLVFPVTFPDSSIVNEDSSLFNIYPSGAIVSLKVYVPAGMLLIAILPSSSVTKGLPFIGVPFLSVISIVAPGTASPVIKSVLVSVVPKVGVKLTFALDSAERVIVSVTYIL